MTEREQDALVRQCLLDALQADWAGVLAQAPQASLSPHQQRRVHAMLADPAGYARRWFRPLWQRALHTAACAALVCLVSLGALLAASPTIRAEFPDWIRQLEFTFFRYEVEGQPTDRSGDVYAITALPEGYTLVRDYELTEKHPYHSWEYENNTGAQGIISLTCVWDGEWTVLRNCYEEEMAKVNGEDAVFYRFTGLHSHRNIPGYALFYNEEADTWPEDLDPFGNILVWTDSSSGVLFELYAYFDKEDMVRMAESVELVSE